MNTLENGINYAKVADHNNYEENTSLVNEFKNELKQMTNITAQITQDLDDVEQEIIIVQNHNLGTYLILSTILIKISF